jgi:hypothetical protein
MSSIDELSLQHLSDKKDLQKSIFREKPPVELVNIVLKNMGFEHGLTDTKSFTKEQIIDEKVDEWVSLLEPYYIPCKARRFLDYLTRDKLITVIRHIIRVHNFDLRTQERVLCGVKKTVYRIEPVTPSFKAREGMFIEFL